MTEKEKEDARYRFKGYDIPKLELDETGHAYYKVFVHPYYRNQPTCWQPAAFPGVLATFNK